MVNVVYPATCQKLFAPSLLERYTFSLYMGVGRKMVQRWKRCSILLLVALTCDASDTERPGTELRVDAKEKARISFEIDVLYIGLMAVSPLTQ